MREIERIASLLEQTFEGRAYYGPSVMDALENVTAGTATRKPDGGAHGIWSLVTHLTAELRYARALLEGTAGPWVEGQTTWPVVADTAATPWQQAVSDLTEANRALVRAVQQLDDAVLDKQLTQVRSTYYVALHGTIQHNAYHAGQISCLKRQLTSKSPE
jgi:uncharacterized damage-inducible protein DinB